MGCLLPLNGCKELPVINMAATCMYQNENSMYLFAQVFLIIAGEYKSKVTCTSCV